MCTGSYVRPQDVIIMMTHKCGKHALLLALSWHQKLCIHYDTFTPHKHAQWLALWIVVKCGIS